MNKQEWARYIIDLNAILGIPAANEDAVKQLKILETERNRAVSYLCWMISQDEKTAT